LDEEGKPVVLEQDTKPEVTKDETTTTTTTESEPVPAETPVPPATT
jgi:hypothetical protein